MTVRNIARIVLLVIALGSPAIWGFRQWERAQAISSATPDAEDALPRINGDQVVMTYFIAGKRCKACREIERLAQETATQTFAAEVASQKLIFRILNTDEPANAAYVSRYQLTPKTLILSHHRDGKEVAWKDMEAVWDLYDQPTAFHTYLSEEILRILKP